jgi:Domain of unknown function (DUF6867)
VTSFSIPEFLSEERSLWVFFLATVVLGGGAAWMTGRAVALLWRPWWRVVLPALALGLAVRFIHFSVFRSVFLSWHYYLVDTAVCLAFALLSFRLTRVRQMVDRYNWINERAGPFYWRRRAQDAAAAGAADASKPV